MARPQATASTVITFSARLQEESERFYRGLAERFPEHGATFRGLAEACARNGKHVTRTYRETVTDALETGYSFEALDLAAYDAVLAVPGDGGLADALAAAITLEERAIAFYQEAARSSEAFLATIPRAFRQVAKKRMRRRALLQDMLADPG
jgi:rubrerythrin